ncbi:sigma-70 family RNA polymerase sigma factor [Lacticaseibacillus brantae]|nr:sigma-70 family RNA polymerase sigma factor [Lacticaseibacillus brantae]
MQNRYQAGFDLFLANKAVVYGALARMAVPRFASNYDDLFHDGMLIFVKYRDPTNTPEAIKKFNRLAGYFVYKTLISRAKDQSRRRQTAFTVDTDTLTIMAEDTAYLASDRLQTNNLLTLVYADLTSTERQVLLLRYFDQFNNTEIASRLAISHQRVGRIRNQILTKYQRLLIEQRN